MTSNEWYTPLPIITAARSVMGSIDLDPASCSLANERVQATRFYTQEQDGLQQVWAGNIFCNPPYHPYPGCRHPSKAWFLSARNRYEDGEVQQVTLLICAEIKYKWFHDTFQFPVCLVSGRVRFHRPNLPDQELRVGSAVVYMGEKVSLFEEIFSKLGTVLYRVDSPHKQLRLL